MLAGLSSATAQRSTVTRDVFRARADSLVFTYLAESHAPSASFAVIRGNDTLAFGAHGLANVDTWRTPTATTIYEIGSNTKQFTSAAIMRLVEQGRVKLDDDLSKYVPQFPLQGKKVSIRQLLNQTSGIHSYTSSPAWAKTWNDELSPDAIIKFVAADTFDFAPGTAYRYNNTGYVLLGMVIEKASGQKYANYLDAQFFKPLGLRQTSYCPSKTSDPAFALGYSKGSSSTRARAVPASVAPIRRRRAVLHGERLREVAARASTAARWFRPRRTRSCRPPTRSTAGARSTTASASCRGCSTATRRSRTPAAFQGSPRRPPTSPTTA